MHARTNIALSNHTNICSIPSPQTKGGITPLSKLTPTTKIARTQAVLSNLKDKNYVKARIHAIPFNLSTLEELQQDPAPLRPRKRKQTPVTETPTDDVHDLGYRMDLA